MRILISTEFFAPYRSDWINELGKHADVTALYLLEHKKEREKAWLSKKPETCTCKLMNGFWFPKLGKISFDFIKEISENSENYDIIILDGYGFATQLLNIRFLSKKNIEFFVNVDGIVPSRRSKENKCFKKKLFSKIPHFLCGSKATNDIFAEYGVGRERIINHPFTSLYEKDIFDDTASETEKEKLRLKLGINEEKIIISVGRFSYLNGYGKGYDVLLNTAKKMSGDFGWYIIGGEPTGEFKKMRDDAQLGNVHFIKHLDKEKLKEYYRAADIFVLMTIGDVWGLVINEAMACGLPIITTDKCMAGLDLVKEGVNGYIIPVGDSERLRDSIDKITEKNSDASMGRASLKIIQPYTIENLAKTHMDVFRKGTEKRD